MITIKILVDNNTCMLPPTLNLLIYLEEFEAELVVISNDSPFQIEEFFQGLVRGFGFVKNSRFEDRRLPFVLFQDGGERVIWYMAEPPIEKLRIWLSYFGIAKKILISKR